MPNASDWGQPIGGNRVPAKQNRVLHDVRTCVTGSNLGALRWWAWEDRCSARFEGLVRLSWEAINERWPG